MLVILGHAGMRWQTVCSLMHVYARPVHAQPTAAESTLTAHVIHDCLEG